MIHSNVHQGNVKRSHHQSNQASKYSGVPLLRESLIEKTAKCPQGYIWPDNDVKHVFFFLQIST